jgi:dTDP-4-dehydrorhamnose 3,5-epimerase
MRFIATQMTGLYIVEPRVWEDRRGFFFESYTRKAFLDAGIDADFVQDNHSRSCPATIRGMHFQAPPHAQDKLVRVVRGSVLDIVIDIRHGSTTYGKWAAFELSAANRRMLLVPKGFAHGFCTLGNEDAETLYKCTDYYAPKLAFGIRWNDPALAIDWPVKDPVLSDQDANYPTLAELPRYFSCAPGPA